MDTNVIDAGDPGSSLILFAAPGPLVPAEVFKPGGARGILDAVIAAVRAEPVDISTPKGRKALGSLVAKVRTTKARFDDMGAEVKADALAISKRIDGERRTIREELDALIEEIRAPLTEYESREKARVQAHEDALTELARTAAFVEAEPSLGEIDARLTHIGTLMQRDWVEFGPRATAAAETARATLQEVRARMVRLAEDRAEAARLAAERAEAERIEQERLRAEREAEIVREAEERARIAAEAAAAEAARMERERVEAERLVTERAEQERAEAAARALREAEEKAEREREAAARREREAAEREATLKRQAEEAEALRLRQAMEAEAEAQKAARDREIAAEESARRAEAAAARAREEERQRIENEAAREREAGEARAKDRAHKGRIHREIAADLEELGMSPEEARGMVIAIATPGKVRHLSVRY